MATASADPIFVMHGARTAIAGGMLHIEAQVEALESAIHQNAGLAFDLAKTLVESALKTIITERSGAFDKNDNLPKLFKAATLSVPFLPAELSGESEARKFLDQTLNGLSTAMQGVCALRNSFGFASHGSDGPRPAMESIQALLAAQAADAIIGFLFRAHRQVLQLPGAAQLQYADNLDFNEWLDQQCEPVRIFSLPPYQPSEVLFSVDPAAYRNLLSEYGDESEEKRDAA
jgi:hypothetical protein